MPKRNISLRSESVTADPLVNAANVLRERERDALRVYRPGNDAQERIHTSPALTLVISGANRCLAGEQKIYDPVRDEWRRSDAIDGNFNVLAMNPDTGELEVADAERPFVKSVDDVFLIEFENGTQLRCSANHKVLCRDGEWREVSRVRSISDS